jgi:N-acetylglucosaminyldiphosphoundecaprenol N-acetyl-beta-D-mannosaminyltransferase
MAGVTLQIGRLAGRKFLPKGITRKLSARRVGPFCAALSAIPQAASDTGVLNLRLTPTRFLASHGNTALPHRPHRPRATFMLGHSRSAWIYGMQFTFGTTQIAVTHKDATAALAEVSARLKAGQGFALATLNMDHLVKLRSSMLFRTAYAAQDIVVADGNPVVWLSRLAGQAVRLVPGSDLVVPLVRVAHAAGRPVILLGSTDAALQGAAAALRAQVPGVDIAATIAPEWGFDPTGTRAQQMLAQIATLGPCLCLLALGAPKQEVFAAQGRIAAPQAGFASVGAGLDFLSGDQRRAPRWVQRLALEWAWRMAQSPRRLVVRYAACAAILPGHCLRAIRQR